MRLEKFMFCMKLETIGLVLGYLGVFLASGFLLFIVSILLLASKSDLGKDPVRLYIEFCKKVTALLTFTYIHVLLIKGIKNKQHKKIKIWLICHGILIIFSVFALVFDLKLGFTVSAVVTYIPVLALYIYCFMAVCSLFENIRDTSELSHQIIANVINPGCSMPPAHI